MKKLLSFFIVLVMLFGLISMQMMSNAEDTSSLPNEEEQIDEAYIEELLRNADEIAYGIYNTTSSMQTYATSLITSVKFYLTREGSKLTVAGITEAASGVDRCGFSYVTIQRKINGNWVNYISWEDLCTNSITYSLAKSVTVPSGYYYRAICDHYALKENLFGSDSEEFYPNETTIMYM